MGFTLRVLSAWTTSETISVSTTFVFTASMCVIVSGHKFNAHLNTHKRSLMKLVDYILAAAMLPQQAINTLHQGELINQVQRDRVAEITSVFVCKCTVRALYSGYSKH